MAEESEKRFHAVMDKLFHAPPKPRAKSTTSSTTITNFASSSGVQLPRGKKRPNSMVERLQKSLVSGGSIQTPLCRPWDRGDLLKRLATFKSMTWFAKPKGKWQEFCSDASYEKLQQQMQRNFFSPY